MKPILVRIKEIISAKGISDSQFARDTETAQTTIANMFGRDSEPRSDLLEKVIENYDVNPVWLLTGKGDMFNANLSLEMVKELEKKVDATLVNNHLKIPLLRQTVSCGPGQDWEHEDNIENYIEPLDAIPALRGKNIYAFQARGISMIGLGIQDGDVLFFDGSRDQDTGDGIYVFGLNGEAFCKLLRFEPLENKVMIYSVQKQDLREAELIRTVDAGSDDFRIFGRVLAWLHENTVLRGI